MSKFRKQNKKANKKVKNAMSLIHNGIEFKSKLELFTYQKLLEADITDFKFEQEKFTILEGFDYNMTSIEAYDRSIEGLKHKLYGEVAKAIRPITYLPDFTSIKDDKTGWVIECKGFPNDAFPLKWKMFKDYLVKNGYNLTLYKPNNQQTVLKTIELIKKDNYEKMAKK